MPDGSNGKEQRHAPTPVLTVQDTIEAFMAPKHEQAFKEFIELWDSSPQTRALIKTAVTLMESDAGQESQKAALSPDSGIKSRDTKLRQDLIAELIEKEKIDPENIARNRGRSFGGLTRNELIVLLEKHKAGNRDLGTYLLVRAWKRENKSPSQRDIRLKRLALYAFDSALLGNRADFFRQLADTVDFLGNEEYLEHGYWDHDPDQWWQFHTLLYILEHPKQRYPIREIVRHFKDEVGATEMPTTKTIRSFFRRHGIALDSRPGAPKKET